ncbi:MAG TPA: VWA domain-containing protein [Acidobacteriota bacterium]
MSREEPRLGKRAHRRRRGLGTAALAVLACFAALLPAAEDLQVRWISHGDGAVVTGEETLRVEVAAPPGARIERVDFYVDEVLVGSAAAAPYQIVHDFGSEILGHVLKATARDSRGLEASALVITREVVLQLRQRVTEVQLNATVIDSKGRFITDLTREDFVVLEDGKPQPIATFKRENLPLVVVLCLDSSGSMLQGDRLEKAQEAAARFVVKTRQEDRLALVDFNHRVYLLQEFTADTVRLTRAVQSTFAEGGTAIHDAIGAAFRLLRPVEERKAVVVFTDGRDESSHAEYGDILEQAKASEVTVYFTAFGVGIFDSDDRQRRELMERLAGVTGGRAFFTNRMGKLSEIFDQIRAELSSQYYLTYTPEGAERDGRWHSIAVKIQGRPELTVRTREGYYAARN